MHPAAHTCASTPRFQPRLWAQGEGEASKGEGASSDAGATAVDNSDEALLLLRALSAQDPAVAAAIRGAASAKGAGAAVPAAQKVQAKQSGCAIM